LRDFELDAKGDWRFSKSWGGNLLLEFQNVSWLACAESVMISEYCPQDSQQNFCPGELRPITRFDCIRDKP
jgi:hypothetical protein